MAVDYLLSKVSILLATLRDVEVVETMSGVIKHLVKGEVMQMRGVIGAEIDRWGGEYYGTKKARGGAADGAPSQRKRG